MDWEKFTTANLLSGLALAVSLATLFLTVRRDRGLLPRLKVSLVVARIQTGILLIEAVNAGPGVAHLRGITYQVGWLRRIIERRAKYDWLRESDSVSWDLPAKLEMGARIEFMLPYEDGWFLGGKVARVGITDNLGRTHWASRKDLKAVEARYRMTFGEAKVS